MKKNSIVMLIVAVIIFAACSKKSHPSKTNEAVIPAKPVATTYAGNVQALIEAKCAPCHLPSKGGRKENLETYDLVKKNITDMIARIEKNPTERGFMPFKNAKLSDEEISVFKKWVTDGLLEK